jgi:hypothetical protein
MLTGWQASQPKLRQEMVIPLPTEYTCPVIIRCWRNGIHSKRCTHPTLFVAGGV